MGELLYCEDDTECAQVAGSNADMECVRNVCVLKRTDTATCYSHADCMSQNKLCAGDGRCVEGVWEVENEYDHDIEFQLYAKDCTSTLPIGKSTSESYTTVGTSPWETVPDILSAYGLCSYRNWFEYLEFVDPANVTLHANQGICRVGTDEGCTGFESIGTSSLWWDSDLDPDKPLQTLWSSSRFKVDAHPCDRDYMYMKGLKGCAPVIRNTLDSMDVLESSRGLSLVSTSLYHRKRLLQTYQPSGIIKLHGGEYYSSCMQLNGIIHN